MATAVGSRGRIAVIGVAVAVLGGAVFLLVEPHVTKTHASACTAAFPERIDPRSSQHLLPDAAEPPYITNPPTSGAHRPGIHPTGLLTAPIERAVQVSMLESGNVLLQYKGLDPSATRQLAALAGGVITVAPNPSLGSPIVATAWLWKMTCSRVDADALRNFVSVHRLEAPTH